MPRIETQRDVPNGDVRILADCAVDQYVQVLHRVHPAPTAAYVPVRHHAGGSHLLYRGWAEHFPQDWELCLLEAPGRGQLQAVPLIDDCDRLVDYFHTAIEPLFGRPFGFFGHGMGTAIAYQLTRRLHHDGDPLPAWLGVRLRHRTRRGPPTDALT
ncbi:thioesterase II family protein [Streptomyces sp. NPDC014894]|uniref:thioesterase II family protein n=1 Tax=Streptomyces sp. NPDC014894 TaxID=3364931 RepID=UPI0036F9977F